ncbi:MAG: ABC transporter ATP-binding protein [Candidatus Lokiarchaeota archaeon]
MLNLSVSLLAPLTFRELIDQGLGTGSSNGNLNVIFTMGVLFFILTIAGVMTRIAQSYIIQKLATLTMYNLRYELFVKFQNLGLDYHESPDKTAGKKISFVTNDVNTIQELISSGLLIVFGNLFTVLGSFGLMIFLSPQLSLASFLIFPIVAIVFLSIFSKARVYFKQLRERVSDVTSELDESIMGMRIIQAFAVEEENYRDFRRATMREKKMFIKAGKLFALTPGAFTFIMTFGLGTIFFTAGILIREGNLTEGTLVAFIFYVFQFLDPLIGLVNFFTVLQNSLAAGARILNLLNETPSIQDKKDAINLNRVEGEIIYENVNFSYEKDQPVLNNINVQIKRKERLALVGYTGAGKSTFIKILSRFYDPLRGDVYVDGKNLKDIKIDSLRRKMGIVLQENFLFSDTVKENIRFGKLDATDEEIIAVAKKVKAHKIIKELKDGYDTMVGERGSKLSEGQKQLIAFARALISDPPILILDEATSSIDPYSELLIQEALETLLDGRTSVSIAHRLSTIINSDRILVMDEGRIIEEGSHQDLIEKGGFYKHLFDMQFKDPYEKKEIF